jgi:hypothetical protein
MSNETPGEQGHFEQGHWKDRLDRLDNSGETWTGKETAWDTLYDRLKDKPRRRRYFLYWMAAAAVLIAIGISLAISIVHERRPEPDVTSSVNPATASPSQKTLAPAQKTSGPSPNTAPGMVVPTHPAMSVADAPAADSMAGETGKMVNGKTGNRVAGSANPVAGSATNAPAPEPVSNPVLPADTPVIASTFPSPPKRTLQVVSINELANPDGENDGTGEASGGGSSGGHYVRFKMGNNPIYSEAAIENAHPGKDMLQIKIHR